MVALHLLDAYTHLTQDLFLHAKPLVYKDSQMITFSAESEVTNICKLAMPFRHFCLSSKAIKNSVKSYLRGEEIDELANEMVNEPTLF